jgi:hypothetical protein
MTVLRKRRAGSVGLRLACGCALVVLVALLLLPSTPGNRSTSDRGVAGTAALSGTLQRMGLRVESMRVGLRPLRDQPKGSVLVVVLAAGPLQSPGFSSIEEQWVLDFVAAGNTLLIAVDRQHPLLDALSVRYQERPKGARRQGTRRSDATASRYQAHAVLPEEHSLYGALSLAGRGGLDLSDSSLEAIYAADGQAVVALGRSGAGQVVVVSDPFTLSNKGLGEGANVAFYLGLISDSLRKDGIVLFDDLHAGASEARGIVAYASRSGFLSALLLALLVALLYLWRAGSRLGGVLPARDRRSARASTEMVHAMAGLYERAGLIDHALTVLSTRLEERVQVKAGVELAKASTSEWGRELGAPARTELQWLHESLLRLATQESPSADDVLRWARRSQQFQSLWLTKQIARDDYSVSRATKGESPWSRS